MKAVKLGIGKGWYRETERHSNAKLYGKAGGKYKQAPPTRSQQVGSAMQSVGVVVKNIPIPVPRDWEHRVVHVPVPVVYPTRIEVRRLGGGVVKSYGAGHAYKNLMKEEGIDLKAQFDKNDAERIYQEAKKENDKENLTAKQFEEQELVQEFFKERFKRKPEADRGYFEEWMDRFRTGHPETYMDGNSLKVYKRLMKEKLSRTPFKTAGLTAKMRKFVNDSGSEMNFDNDLSESQIKERLSWMGKNWKEVKGKNLTAKKKIILTANDTDMWRDIEHLERSGRKKQSDDLLKVYSAKFINSEGKKAEKLRAGYRKKYGHIDNYW